MSNEEGTRSTPQEVPEGTTTLWIFKARVALIILLGTCALILLIVANEIFSGNNKRFEDCFKRREPKASYRCKSSYLPVKLAMSAMALATAVFILGIQWSFNYCCLLCHDNHGTTSCAKHTACGVTITLLVAHLGFAAVLAFVFLIFMVYTRHIVSPYRDERPGHCLCNDYMDEGEFDKGLVVMAAAVAALTISGTGHLTAARWARRRVLW